MDYNENNIIISENNTLVPRSTSFIAPKQSANSLFHFMGENINFLLDDIMYRALPPLYCREDLEYLNIDMKAAAFPMICFCDINLHKIHLHADDYGPYGIAFSKEWGIEKGIQPIQYMNEESILASDFSEAFNHTYRNSSNSPEKNYLLTHLFYLKPLCGIMEKTGKRKNLCDECEWRFIPDFNRFELPQAIPEQEMYTKEKWNNLILNLRKTWLDFEYSDIKYIIVSTRKDIDLIWKALSTLKIDDIEKANILSKVLVMDEIKEDA